MVNIFFLDTNPKKCAKYYCNKHVNKILIEILQILSQAHHYLGNKNPPYKKCLMIKDTLAPYKWATLSTGNYNYCADLAYYLLLEYKFRYNNREHKCENAVLWLRNNIPTDIKIGRRTKFLLTENVKIYSRYYKNIVEASRLVYVDFKCKNDNWGKREIPSWFVPLKKTNDKNKKILIKKIFKNVKEKLPKLYKNEKDVKVKRFHSFLRICYDNLFLDKWDRKIKTLPNMFNPSKPLIYQLGIGHLYYVLEISNKLLIKKKINELNYNSLKFRGKIKNRVNKNF